MREKLTQIHKNLRKQAKQQYFKQKRQEILVYRQRQALEKIQSPTSSFARFGWRNIFLHEHQMEQQQNDKSQSFRSDIDLDITLNSIEDGEYYLNTILQQANIRCLSSTIYLLNRLVSKLMRPIRKLAYFQQKNQINLIQMILTHIHNMLQVKTNRTLILSKNKKYIVNLFGEDCKLLLSKHDPIIIDQLTNIFQIMCDQLNIPPNYHLIQHLLLQATMKLQGESGLWCESASKSTSQYLIMKYLILCKIEERSNLKQVNIPYQQIIYDFNAYIQFYLDHIYHFIRNHQHSLEYDFINNTLCYVLTLYIQLIRRFKSFALSDREKQIQGEFLVKEAIILLLQKIILTLPHFVGNESNEVGIVCEQTVTNILWYLNDSKLQSSRRQMRRLCVQGCEGQYELGQNESIISAILLIKVKLRQLTPRYE